MKNRLSRFAASTLQTIREFPVEVAIMVYAFVVVAFMIDDAGPDNEANIALAPLFFALAYILNSLFPLKRRKKESEDDSAGEEPAGREKPCKFRWTYYLCWMPIIPLWLIDPEDWIFSVGYFIAVAIAFMGILACRQACDNKRFAYESLNYIIDAAMALVFSSIAYGLLLGIYYSVTYIFGLDNDFIPHFPEYLAAFTYIIAAPLMLLTFVRGNIGRNLFPSRFLDILLNFIVTPALLIYTAILYLYFIKIIVTWSLPQGGIAIMVFIFTMVAVIAKGWQPLLGRRFYDWFFDRFSLISVPAVIMFWIAVLRRTGEYGLTEERIYLLLCGGIMTATLVMFACRNRGKYITVLLITAITLAVFTYIPPVSAENLAISNQKARVLRYAGRLGMLDESDMFKEADKMPSYDSLNSKEYARILSGLKYLDRNNRPLFGLSSPYSFNENYPSERDRRNSDYRYYYNHKQSYDIRGYSTLYSLEHNGQKDGLGLFCESHNDTLRIFRHTDASLARADINAHDSDTTTGNAASIGIIGGADGPTAVFVAGKPEAVQDDIVEETTTMEPASSRTEIFSIPNSELIGHLLTNAGYSLENLPEQKYLEDNNAGSMFEYETGQGLLVLSHFSLTVENGKIRDCYITPEYLLVK